MEKCSATTQPNRMGIGPNQAGCKVVVRANLFQKIEVISAVDVKRSKGLFASTPWLVCVGSLERRCLHLYTKSLSEG